MSDAIRETCQNQESIVRTHRSQLSRTLRNDLYISITRFEAEFQERNKKEQEMEEVIIEILTAESGDIEKEEDKIEDILNKEANRMYRESGLLDRKRRFDIQKSKFNILCEQNKKNIEFRKQTINGLKQFYDNTESEV